MTARSMFNDFPNSLFFFALSALAMRRDEKENGTVPQEHSATRLALSVVGLWVVFAYWGVLQERLFSTGYEPILEHEKSDFCRQEGLAEDFFHFPFLLNCVVSIFAFLVGILSSGDVWFSQNRARGSPGSMFFRPALTMSLASPLGYSALQYISYPMALLAKSCKLPPVMLAGYLFNDRRYQLYEYVGVFLISVGVGIFSIKPTHGDGEPVARGDGLSYLASLILGLGLVLSNLILDSLTLSLQDRITVANPHLSALQVMWRINAWASVLHVAYLIPDAIIFGAGSSTVHALHFIFCKQKVARDILLFGLAAAVGQIFVFNIINESNGLILVIATLCRKVVSMALSVFLYNHHLSVRQFIGILCVFGGASIKPLSTIVEWRRRKHKAA